MGISMDNKKINPLFTKKMLKKLLYLIFESRFAEYSGRKVTKGGVLLQRAYRVKAVDSMVNKLIFKDYRRKGTENEDKKMQDLIGIRIMLYFSDDLEICMRLLDTLFVEPGKWETTENNEMSLRQ